MTVHPIKFEPRLVEPAPIDITALIRADIAKRNWKAMHIAADRRGPVEIADPTGRTWR